MNPPSLATLLLGALACLLLALALWLYGRARHQQHERTVHQHMQRALDRSRNAAPMPMSMTATAPVLPGKEAAAPPVRPWVQRLRRLLGVDAWGLGPQMLTMLVGAGLLAVLLAGVQAGLAAALGTAVLYVLAAAFGIWRRVSQRRRRLLLQLPGFLDNMVRLISIGNSPHAAFQMAVPNVPAPLGEALQQAAAMLSASPDLGQAMAQLERTWRLPEFGLLAAVFRMSVRYGGRADLVLERVSAYIRDRQSAERELHALSAEIRMSAWVLALLPIVVGMLIMLLNQGYFLRMWNDASGQKMILAAAGLEAVGAFLLYRLAQLK